MDAIALVIGLAIGVFVYVRQVEKGETSLEKRRTRELINIHAPDGEACVAVFVFTDSGSDHERSPAYALGFHKDDMSEFYLVPMALRNCAVEEKLMLFDAENLLHVTWKERGGRLTVTARDRKKELELLVKESCTVSSGMDSDHCPANVQQKEAFAAFRVLAAHLWYRYGSGPAPEWEKYKWEPEQT